MRSTGSERIEKANCADCGKSLEYTGTYCSFNCRAAFEKEYEKGKRKLKYFIAGILLGFVLMFLVIGRGEQH